MTITIQTTPETAALIALSLRQHALGVRYEAEIPGEQGEEARQIYDRLRRAHAEVVAATQAPAPEPVP